MSRVLSLETGAYKPSIILDPYTLENKHVQKIVVGDKPFLLKWLLFRGRSLVFGGVLLPIPVNPHNTLNTIFCTGLRFFVHLFTNHPFGSEWLETNKQDRNRNPGKQKNILKNIGKYNIF